ncbi:hypothetical protein SGP15004_23550 [Shigella flexneri]|nr:hypothetical protein SGP12012_20440 [Shigella flexneri]GLG13353.1 hypothetical protein SGP12048_26240 [Shigella flexneri]GLG17877.1 hypothetical protein SGP12049_26870 [Shigella flexneri]GLG22250.1 hypothetical protein SGP14013_26370 [Shigella flexneri]GLG26720.1 hypothetical protein SGP14014_25660 [Shigella flexneri]
MNDPEIIVIKQRNNYKKSLMHPVLQADETPIVWAMSVRQVAWGNMFRRCQAGAPDG